MGEHSYSCQFALVPLSGGKHSGIRAGMYAGFHGRRKPASQCAGVGVASFTFQGSNASSICHRTARALALTGRDRGGALCQRRFCRHQCRHSQGRPAPGHRA